MLNIINNIIFITSVYLYFTSLNEILTYGQKGIKNNKIVFYALLIVFYGLIYSLNIKEFNDINVLGFFGIVIITLLGIYYVYYCKVRSIKYVVLFILFNIYHSLLYNIIFRFLIILITGYSFSGYGFLSVSRLEQSIITLCSYILIFIIYKIIKYINNCLKLFDNEKKKNIYMCIALLVNISQIVFNYIFGFKYITSGSVVNSLFGNWITSLNYLEDEWVFYNHIVNPNLVIASSIIIWYIFRNTIKENKVKSQHELMKNKLDMQYNHYLKMQESHMKVKKLYHDITNHLYCIDNIQNNKNVKEYIYNLNEEISDFKYIYDTGNMILDIIVNEKEEICKSKNINYSCKINFSMMEFIKPIDVSSIFANILDNAIEACDRIKDDGIKKYVNIRGTVVNSIFIIKCENSKINRVRINKGRVLTDKVDDFIHGIGITSIKSSLKKYNGELVIEDLNEKFILNIYIPLNQDDHK